MLGRLVGRDANVRIWLVERRIAHKVKSIVQRMMLGQLGSIVVHRIQNRGGEIPGGRRFRILDSDIMSTILLWFVTKAGVVLKGRGEDPSFIKLSETIRHAITSVAGSVRK